MKYLKGKAKRNEIHSAVARIKDSQSNFLDAASLEAVKGNADLFKVESLEHHSSLSASSFRIYCVYTLIPFYFRHANMCVVTIYRV